MLLSVIKVDVNCEELLNRAACSQSSSETCDEMLKKADLSQQVILYTLMVNHSANVSIILPSAVELLISQSCCHLSSVMLFCLTAVLPLFLTVVAYISHAAE